MLYKEWITVRFKVWLWLALYGVMGLLSVTWLSPTRYYVQGSDYLPSPLFSIWLSVSALITVFAAILGGVDVLAEELDRGTLSFLLTRPISRTRIYTSKILMNVAGLVGSYILVGLLILLIDRFQPNPINLWEALGTSAQILLLGTGIICLGGLISIFVRNTLQTLAFTMAVVVVSFAAFIGMSGFFLVMGWKLSTSVLLTLLTIILCILPPALFYSGLFFFKRKEF